ncbi:MAG: hypothetical protein RLZZ500_1032 [Bacteroidota bacterium]
MNFFSKKAPFYSLLRLYVITGVLLRIVLLFHPITQSHFGVVDYLKIFFFGFCSDLLVFTVASVLLWLYLITLSNSKFEKPKGYIFLGIWMVLLIYVASGKSILSEYGGSLPEIGLAFIGLKTILFALLLFLPQYRKNIRLVLYSITLFLFVLLIIQNAISEFFFWNEFGVRYNFIAVDYLVYTNEVIGNIMESYPVVPLFSGVGLIAVLGTYYVIKQSKGYLEKLPDLRTRLLSGAAYVVVFVIALFAIPRFAKLENSDNVFTNELQASGLYKFYGAFMNSELDFKKFYQTIPDHEAVALMQAQIGSIEPGKFRTIKSDSTEIQKNVVLITIESFSADFMKHYGNTQNITPFLDNLSDQSMFFTNLYAVGNRTVRGLESVTLCLPPSPGESVVKRKDNKNKFSTGSIFASKGYAVRYLYGGDAYFDNMQDFFGGNGYTIVDKKSFKPEEITFSNIWGVCDEDMAKKAIQTMNAEAQSGKPFFNHWMTVSNHRPFTYPDHKIDIDSHSKSREGGVKYTDYALQQFFKMAEKQSWFKNTIFVIVADHCASSSGKTELPLNKYRIPAMIYAPGFIQPQKVTQLVSQIDLMPTVLGLLHFNYDSKFIGQDVFSPNYKERALIATYQDLGLIKNNRLTIISPKQKVKQFDLKLQQMEGVSPEFQSNYEEIPVKKMDEKLVKETIAYYQFTTDLLQKKQYQKK